MFILSNDARDEMVRALDAFNGHPNYETWGVVLVLNDSPESQERILQLARAARDNAPNAPQVLDGIWTAPEAARFTLADALKDYVESMRDDACPLTHARRHATPAEMMVAQMFSAAVSRVDWDDIARDLLDELPA